MMHQCAEDNSTTQARDRLQLSLTCSSGAPKRRRVMASLRDIRKRIKSVKNTRQITKAMKMVSAARLRRSQEAAMAARPYAKMIASVLESLSRRIEIYDPETGNLRHPLFATRDEKRVLLIVVSGD